MEAVILRGAQPIGSGDGDGYGDGYGYGSGSGSFWRATIPHAAARWSDAQKTRLSDLEKAGATIALWRSSATGVPANGGTRIEPAAPGVTHTSPGPLSLCEKGTLHATLIPTMWKGPRVWVVALIGEVVGNDEKMGCLKREIIGELPLAGGD